jgi:hypothetical protein
VRWKNRKKGATDLKNWAIGAKKIVTLSLWLTNSMKTNWATRMGKKKKTNTPPLREINAKTKKNCSFESLPNKFKKK